MKLRTLVGVALASVGVGCSDAAPHPGAPPCDLECQDQVAVRALREGMKLIYNIKLQGEAVGEHDEMTPCPQAGTARVFGIATSNAEQGATQVELTYAFTGCKYVHVDEAPAENYQMIATGSIAQTGVIAVQPSATTALLFHGDSLSLEGSMYDPPIEYRAEECVLDLAQSGNDLSGTWCGREVGVAL